MEGWWGGYEGGSQESCELAGCAWATQHRTGRLTVWLRTKPQGMPSERNRSSEPLLSEALELGGCEETAFYLHCEQLSGFPPKLQGVKMSLRKQTPSDFLKQIIGRPVVVKLNSGVDYRGTAGVLACLDGYMNIAIEQTEEYVNGQLKNKYGDAFLRGNNVLYISTQKRKHSPNVMAPQSLVFQPVHAHSGPWKETKGCQGQA
ncbi:hypothetical protein CCH79_00009202 [Gambusia affinis]|uniref:U6 snRNA-associated Sm-like protein LSm6 n=1 Tax=Gambusia affinis TaxID=33528 RepID=A0A315W442_GAMAF|nr:hypothetical protein CCH79_00009202 [Gambusia affinis]